MGDDIIRIGIPRALIYYKYKDLWFNFFHFLGIDVIISPETNKKILNNGIKLANDEACLSLKIYLGHVNEIINKCDYVLVPRIENPIKNEKTCTNFYVLYDLVSTYFGSDKLINYNITNKNNEKDEFIKIGNFLGFSYKKSLNAYNYAKNVFEKNNKLNFINQNKIINSNNKKVLLVSHSYNVYDSMIGKDIINFFKKNNIDVINADYFDSKLSYLANNISRDIYWTFNKKLLAAIEYYKNYVDGIILLSTFPCGPDSLVNDLVIRKIKNVNMIEVILDDLNSNTGIITRLESFIDIISQEKVNER